MSMKLKIGCHLSFSQGYVDMANTAVEINANTFAFFTRNPRGGSAKAIKQDDVNSFLEMAERHNFAKLVAHSPYTLNACSADPSIRDFAIRTMSEDLERMEYTPNNYYNFHPGSHVKQGTEIGIDFICQMLNKVLKENQTTTVLLETMSGKGSEVGRTFEELKQIIDRVELKEKLGVCFDTCHVWDAGYDIVNNLDGVLEEFDKIIGISRLKAIHLNDSKNPCSAHKDRHELIGMGHIGNDAIIRIINHPKLRDLPFILETPNNLDGYAKEIKFLRNNYND